jgi:hypothetical protein
MPVLRLLVTNDYFVRPEMSFDGQTIVVAGSYKLYFVDPQKMNVIASIKIKSTKYCKITDHHVFLKHSNTDNTEWTMISYKDSHLSKLYGGVKSQLKDTKSMQYIVSEGINKENPIVLGIFSNAEGLKQGKFYQKIP